MKNLTQLGGVIVRVAKEHSPLILSTMAGAGVIFTSYLTARASYQAALIIRAHEDVNGTNQDTKERVKDRTKLVWKLYIPPAISAVSTISFIVGANRFGSAKTLAAQTALTATERAYSEYRDKVVEELGARKDQSIRDKVAEDRIRNEPPPSQSVLVTGPGHVLCCELYTGRYFVSDMESLRRAVNDINEKMLKHDHATLDDWYYLLDLKITTTSGNMGWTSDKLMELSFSTALTEDNRPCITFEYNYIKLL